MNQTQSTIDIVKITEEINKKEISINNAEKARNQAEGKKDILRVQYEDLNKELKALGVEPKEAYKYLAELDSQIIKDKEELDELIPEGY